MSRVGLHRASNSERKRVSPVRRISSIRTLVIWSLQVFIAIVANGTPASAAEFEFPDGFQARQIDVEGGTQYVRFGGQGPAVLLLHGFGDTGDMWVPLAKMLIEQHHTVIVPDLR